MKFKNFICCLSAFLPLTAFPAWEKIATFDSLDAGDGIRGYRKMDVFLLNDKNKIKRIDQEFNIWEVYVDESFKTVEGSPFVEREDIPPTLINCNILKASQYFGQTDFLKNKAREKAIYNLQRNDNTYDGTPANYTNWHGSSHLIKTVCGIVKNINPNETTTANSKEDKVTLRKKGGVFELPVKVNNEVTIHFILDSGASDVSIPKQIALILADNGSITSGDIKGNVRYRIANGSTMQGLKVIIKSLEVGGHTLRNVEASVVDGPPLLGQSFLGRLQEWSIDPRKHIFKFKP
jgi:aspartyl protease family protein